MKMNSDALSCLPESSSCAIPELTPEPDTRGDHSKSDEELPQAQPRSIHPLPSARRNGKIARLPRKLRDLINQLLDDGASYAQIVERLNQSTDPPLPCQISERNISGWRVGGYQDWLRHQEHRELLSSKLDFALDLARNSPPEKIQELSLQLAALRICEFLSDLAIPDSQLNLNTYLRLLSALPRISKETLNLQKYRNTCTMAPATTSNE